MAQYWCVDNDTEEEQVSDLDGKWAQCSNSRRLSHLDKVKDPDVIGRDHLKASSVEQGA